MRLFLDANVLFSAAHNPRGNARAFFALATQGAVTLLCSRFARDEALRNIKLKFPDCYETLAELLKAIELVSEPPPSLIGIARAAGLPEKDAPILAAAIASRVDMLVTGDKRHFGHLFGQHIETVLVLPPVDALVFVLNQIAATISEKESHE
jgi:uncharacterized protein